MNAREEEAQRLLAEQGLPMARVRACGHAQDVAVLTVPAAEWSRLVLGDEGRALSARIKALGYRYVTLDLEPPVPDQ